LPSLKLGAKALELFHEHSNIFQEVRIITDIRPVFGQTTSNIEGALIVNCLKIKYFDASGPKELYIGVDEDDLKSIKETIERALSKTGSLNEMLMLNKINNLTIEAKSDAN
jgi:hypothetical protein